MATLGRAFSQMTLCNKGPDYVFSCFKSEPRNNNERDTETCLPSQMILFSDRGNRVYDFNVFARQLAYKRSSTKPQATRKVGTRMKIRVRVFLCSSQY